MVEFFQKMMDGLTNAPLAATNAHRYGVAVSIAGVAILSRWLIDPLLGDRYPFLFALLAVICMAWYGGFGPAVTTLLLTSVGGVLLFLPPRHAFDLHRLADQIGLGIYLFCGIAVALVGEAQRTSRRRLGVWLRDATRQHDELAVAVARRNSVEEEVRASEARFRLLTETIPQMIWTADPAGRSTYFNGRWKEYTGLDPELAKKQGWKQIVHPDDADGLEAAWQAAVELGEGEFMYDFRLCRSDGEYLWHLANAVPLRNPSGEIIEWVSALTDIDLQKRQRDALERMVRERTATALHAVKILEQEVAERQRAEIKERALTADLRRSNEELEQFAYVASHDLQEPLRKIRAFGDRLLDKFHDQLGEQGADYIDRMQKAATRMQQLIDDLLTVSRVTSQAQPFKPVNLEVIARDVLGDLEERIVQSGGQVEVGPLPTINADASQMHQLLLNLIGNALKFHRPAILPLVRVTAEEIGKAGNGAYRAMCRLVVADNGIGFEERFRERIFHMFQRLHGRDKYEGTGIGLAICHKIVLRHGGTIIAHSEPGHGSSFEILLPIERPLEKTRDGVSNETSDGSHSG